MEEDYVMIPGSGTKKIIRDVKKEIETAFLDYSMSVIVSRALQLAQPLGALVVGHGGAAGVPDFGGPDLSMVAVADDGHVLFQSGVGAQLCGQQDASLLPFVQ